MLNMASSNQLRVFSSTLKSKFVTSFTSSFTSSFISLCLVLSPNTCISVAVWCVIIVSDLLLQLVLRLKYHPGNVCELKRKIKAQFHNNFTLNYTFFS